MILEGASQSRPGLSLMQPRADWSLNYPSEFIVDQTKTFTSVKNKCANLAFS